MSEREKLDPARVWSFVEDLLADAEAERVEKLSPDELREEMRKEGLDPSREPKVDEFVRRASGQPVKRAAPAAPVAPAPRRKAPFVWLIAACLGIAGVLFFVLRDDSNRGSGGKPPRVLAEELRDEALRDCDRHDWATCTAKLDEAAKLDPSGEREERVQKAREGIERRVREKGESR